MEKKTEVCVWPAHMLTCSPHVLSRVSVKVPVYWPYMPLQKLSGVAIFVWIFQTITLHRETNSPYIVTQQN